MVAGPAPRSEGVLVVDGYGVSLSVRRGRLVIRDGMAAGRQERTLSRADRTVRRLIILGDTGTVSLDAVRWCADVGIALVQLDRDGRVLLTATPPGTGDARLRRAQAAAANNQTGVEITRALLGGKLAGQAAVAADLLGAESVADLIDHLRDQLADAPGLPACRDLESQASNLYFGAWAGQVSCAFATRDRERVPDHWTVFTGRRSPLHGSRTPRTAADPINALLNYCYALAEVECRLAAIRLGLDPGMGIVHTDKKYRDSLALDLLEPLRPLVERHLLTVLATRTFRAADFHETREGVCRLLDPLTHELCEQLPAYAAAVAPIAEKVAHALATSSPGKIALTTPLSRVNVARAQTRGARSRNRRDAEPAPLRRTCQQCGTDLYGSARKLCPTCWPITRNAYLLQYNHARGTPPGPPKPITEQLSGGLTLKDYQTKILPALARVSLADIERATGLANSSCCRVRQGKQMPNPSFWGPLAELGRLVSPKAVTQ